MWGRPRVVTFPRSLASAFPSLRLTPSCPNTPIPFQSQGPPCWVFSQFSWSEKETQSNRNECLSGSREVTSMPHTQGSWCDPPSLSSHPLLPSPPTPCCFSSPSASSFPFPFFQFPLFQRLTWQGITEAFYQQTHEYLGYPSIGYSSSPHLAHSLMRNPEQELPSPAQTLLDS